MLVKDSCVQADDIVPLGFKAIMIVCYQRAGNDICFPMLNDFIVAAYLTRDLAR